MNLTMHWAAGAEVVAAAAWYERRQPGLGRRFLDALDKALHRIAAAPETCARAEEQAKPGVAQRYRLHRFPYVVYFVTQSEGILVLAVAHVRRRPEYWQDRQ